MQTYEQVIQWVEQHPVTEESDRILQELGEELETPAPELPALRQAVRFLAEAPRSAAPLTELTSQPSSAELDRKIALFIDIIFDELNRQARN